MPLFGRGRRALERSWVGLRHRWRRVGPAPSLRTIRGPLGLQVLAAGASELAGYGELVYAPDDETGRLDEDALANAVLGLSHLDYDFLLFSRSLHGPPLIHLPASPRQSIVFARRAAGFFLRGEPVPRPLRGRVVRMPGLKGDFGEVPVGSLFPGLPLRIDGPEIVVGAGEPPALGSIELSGIFIEPPPVSRPVVFVWPALWGVGGVERLAVEIMRQLRERYGFVVVTTERLSAAQGSLHLELKGLALATYDLGEIAPPSRHLSMLVALERVYRPSLVWMCNGSPWLCDHAGEIREAYSHVPIVGQIAYDTRVGWITRYDEPGIRSFDRHVAINGVIRGVFVDELRIDPGRVDLIYHAYDGSRFDAAGYGPERVASLRRAYGIPADARLFVFVGRMTAQKRPLDFVRLAKACGAGRADLRFLMLGDGDLAGDVDASIRSCAPGRVARLPFSDRIPEVLAIADGLVITSEYEGLPVAMLEALAMGVPVLATNVGDIRPLLEELGAGVVVPRTGDHASLVSAFHGFLGGLPRYREAARAASAVVRARFSGETVAARYDACWRRATEERSAGGSYRR